MTQWHAMPGELTTARLRLDAWRDDDLDAYTELIGERAPGPRSAVPPQAELRERIARQRAALAGTGIGLLVVRVDGRFAGYCGLIQGRSSLAEPEIAYELLRAEQGRGYATEAAGAIVDAAARTGRSRLWATVRSWNTASFRVLDKIGFVHTDRVSSDEWGELVWCTRELP